MECGTPFEVLGLDSTASLDTIKCAYRTLAKRFHPDKSDDPDAKTVFQRLNNAYRILLNQLSRDDNSQQYHNNDKDNNGTPPLSDISITLRENSESVTIDITDMMFLIFLDQCEKHHGISPVDRGNSGQQLRFPYTSPHDDEQFGSLSLTFYPTTSRLLVQGTSYLLWVDEHMPIIYKDVEVRYLADISSWRGLALRRGIGVRRSQRQRRDRVTCRSSPGATSSDSCIGTLPTDCCRESIAPADISTGALFLTIGTPHTNGSTGTSPTGSCDGDALPTDICLEVLHADCIGSPQAVSGSPEVVPGNRPPDSGSPSVVSGSPSAVSGVPHNNGCVDAPPDDARRGQPVGATFDREDDSDLQLPGNKAVSHKSRKSGKSAGAKKSGAKKTTKKGKNKSHIDSDTRTRTASQPYCYEDCVLNGKPGPDMIRCSLCMKWFQISCSGEEATYNGVWSCISCRKVPSLLSDLKSEIANLNTHLNNVLTNEETLKDEIRRLRSENGKLKQKVVTLETNNGDLKKLIETMSDITTEKEQSADAHSSAAQHPNQPTAGFPAFNICTSNRYAALASVTEVPPAGGRAPVLAPTLAPVSATVPIPGRARPNTPAQPTTVTVIGSSIVRGVAPLVHGCSFEATGYVYPGHTPRQINAHIRHIPASDVTVLAAGTNNIELQTVEQCTRELSQVIDNVARKRNGKVVIIGRIPYRHDKPHLNNKIDHVNQFIAREVSKRNKWFLMSTELAISDYKKDGLHFNETGTAKYAHEIRHAIRSIKRCNK